MTFGSKEETNVFMGVALFVASILILLFDFQIPWSVVDFYNSVFGKLSTLSIILYLLYSRQFVLSMVCILFAIKLDIVYQSYIPSESQKRAVLSSYNRNLHQMTLEEEMVAQSALELNVSNSRISTSSPYLPIMSKAHGAMELR